MVFSDLKIRKPDGDGSVDVVGGGLRQWHKVSLTLNGPYTHETFLAYEDFDGTYKVKNKLKTWEPRLQDAKKGDPTWRDGKGKAILGALTTSPIKDSLLSSPCR